MRDWTAGQIHTLLALQRACLQAGDFFQGPIMLSEPRLWDRGGARVPKRVERMS